MKADRPKTRRALVEESLIPFVARQSQQEPAMSTEDGFQLLRLRRERIREIDDFVQSELAKELGYKNRAEFVDRAVRDKFN